MGAATERLIAYQGEVELLNASWAIDAGRMIEFRLEEQEINPFKIYQKRRNGKVGQRFHVSITSVDNQSVVYDGEIMLAGWADNSRKGQTVRLWLDEEATTHPFSGYEKSNRFVAVFVQLTDDNKPVDQVAQGRAEAVEQARGKRKLSAEAHLMITGDAFLRYMQHCVPVIGETPWNSYRARRWVKWRLKIPSLADLDSDQKAAHLFHELIRKPFAEWNGVSE